jgi:hypothetical protein
VTAPEGRPTITAIGDGDVVLDVPASPRSLRLIRLAAADAAAELGFDVDGVESARIAVDELAAVLFDTGDWSRFVLVLERGDGVLSAHGQVHGRGDGRRAVQVDRVVQELLSTCVQHYEVSDDDPDAGPRFSCAVEARPER